MDDPVVRTEVYASIERIMAWVGADRDKVIEVSELLIRLHRRKQEESTLEELRRRIARG